MCTAQADEKTGHRPSTGVPAYRWSGSRLSCRSSGEPRSFQIAVRIGVTGFRRFGGSRQRGRGTGEQMTRRGLVR
jgi:hypothetical protein